MYMYVYVYAYMQVVLYVYVYIFMYGGMYEYVNMYTVICTCIQYAYVHIDEGMYGCV